MSSLSRELVLPLERFCARLVSTPCNIRHRAEGSRAQDLDDHSRGKIAVYFIRLAFLQPYIQINSKYVLSILKRKFFSQGRLSGGIARKEGHVEKQVGHYENEGDIPR